MLNTGPVPSSNGVLAKFSIGTRDFRLAVLCLLVILSHTAVSFFEEELFKRRGFTEGFFMIFIMCVQYSIFHAIAKPFFLKQEPSISEMLHAAGERRLMRSLVLLCLAYAGSNSISKMALGFVTIPTQIVFKSCKLVAVMLGSGVILGKRYSWYEYFIASLLVAGMICFAGADMRANKSADAQVDTKTIIGCTILVLALACDSILGNMQEKVQKGGVCDELSLMYLQSIFGTIFLGVVTGVNGELQSGIMRCYQSSLVFWCLMAWSLLNMFGIVIMLKVAGEYSAVTAVLTSSCRKFTSLIVSYVFFPKPLSIMHGAGLVFVFGAIFLHTWWKQNMKKTASSSASGGGAGMTLVTTPKMGSTGHEEELGLLGEDAMTMTLDEPAATGQHKHSV